MHITQTMADGIKEAVLKISAERPFVEITDMGGYFVTLEKTEIPKNAKRFATTSVDGEKYLVFMTLDEIAE